MGVAVAAWPLYPTVQLATTDSSSSSQRRSSSRQRCKHTDDAWGLHMHDKTQGRTTPCV